MYLKNYTANSAYHIIIYETVIAWLTDKQECKQKNFLNPVEGLSDITVKIKAIHLFPKGFLKFVFIISVYK